MRPFEDTSSALPLSSPMLEAIDYNIADLHGVLLNATSVESHDFYCVQSIFFSPAGREK